MRTIVHHGHGGRQLWLGGGRGQVPLVPESPRRQQRQVRFVSLSLLMQHSKFNALTFTRRPPSSVERLRSPADGGEG